ncbi:IS4 family transposase [Alysiella crassa]|uniref:Transposase n=1 Tax=Alysiella crassa TaxID=153491 RepID=A0A376BNH6_9NEIS|nr:IS4 family transposase [Alysiella crassa]UOP06671.1 IS4 family transposase [Alysiella crassa]SSY71226.1 Transposase [Alysiella crassa]
MTELSELTHIVTKTFKWHKSHIIVFVYLLCTIAMRQTCNLSKLAMFFPDAKATNASSYRRIQRFFKEVVFDYDAVAKLIMGLLGLQEVQLIFDRTHWQLGKKHNNILVLAIVYKGVGMPIFWTGLNNGKGNSNTEQRIDLIERFKSNFPHIQITNVLADAEFIGKDWFNYLNKENIPFCIPIRSNAKVQRKGKQDKMHISRCFDDLKKTNEIKCFKNRKTIYGNKVYLSGVRLPDKTLLIVASSTFQGADLLDKYRQRWQIEMLFSCLKKRGFDLEATHMTDPVKMEKLFAILAVTLAWAYVIGRWQHALNPIKPKSHERLSQGIFRVGLEQLAKAAMLMMATLDYFSNPKQVVRFFVVY